MAKPGVMFYFDVRPCIKRLSINEKGLLFEAILDYGEFGKLPDLDGALGVAWDFIQPKLDRDTGRYDKQVEQRQYAVFVREMKKRGNDPIDIEEWRLLTDNERYRLLSVDNGEHPTSNLQTTTPTSNLQLTTGDNKGADKPPRSRFSPPTSDEVRQYCFENNYTIDADRFVSYYESNGWMVGRNKMKSWEAAVRNWATKEKDKPKQIYESGIDRLARMYREEFGE